jgi:hypothetical protein
MVWEIHAVMKVDVVQSAERLFPIVANSPPHPLGMYLKKPLPKTGPICP